MSLATDRLSLPLLAVAQSQKEMTHNEALALLDAVVQPVVVAMAPATTPSAPTLGQGWIVGPAPSGAWAGQADRLAVWTSGGWRFVTPFAGMTVWNLADSLTYRRTASAWIGGQMTATALTIGGNQVVASRQPSIATPSGGTTVDAESRAATGAILTALRTHGLISM